MAQGQGQTLHQILITANIDDVNTKISMISDMLRRLNKEWESFGTSKPTSASPMIEKLEKASRVAKESTKEQVNAEKGLTLQIKEKNKELQKTSRLMSDVARSVRDIPKDIPDIILQAEYAGKAGGVRRYLAQGIVRGTMMGSDVAETLEELQKNPVYFDAIATGIKEQADLVEGKVISLQESIISSYRQIHAIREKHKPLFDDEIESLDEFEKRIRGMKTLGELEPEREIVKAMYTQTRDVARYAAGEVPADPSLLASLQAEYSKYYQAVSKYDKERIDDLETIEEFQRSSVNLTKEQAEQLRAIFSEQRRLLESEDRVAKARERRCMNLALRARK